MNCGQFHFSRKKTRRALQFCTTYIMVVLLSPLAGRADWKSEADNRIKENRQRDVSITVVDAAGNPAPGAKVSVRQTRKAFPFGSAMGATLLRNEQYRDFFKEHFNYAVFENESKWYSNERLQGRENYRAADAMFEWCQENGIPVRGHCVYWEPDKWQPRWLTELDSRDVRTAVERRINSVVPRFRDKFVSWDVNNEMIHGSFFKDHLGPEIHPWMFTETHRLDPNAKLFVNEYNILSIDQNFSETELDEYIDHIRWLIDQGAPVQGIGVQGHIWAEDISADPESIKHCFDELAAFDLPIWISEFDVADEDQQSNADKLEIVYRMAYSHPQVEGIMMWVFWSSASWRGANAGIANDDWTLNEAGKRYEALMKEWSTNVSGATDENGVYSRRGFYGDYEIEVSVGDGTTNQTFQLISGDGTQEIAVQLP